MTAKTTTKGSSTNENWKYYIGGGTGGAVLRKHCLNLFSDLKKKWLRAVLEINFVSQETPVKTFRFFGSLTAGLDCR